MIILYDKLRVASPTCFWILFSQFPIEMIAKLERTLSTNQGLNTEPLQKMGATITNESTTIEPPPVNRRQPKSCGILNAF